MFEMPNIKEMEKNGTKVSYVSHDMVDHPDHYQSKSGLEAIDVIEAFTSDMKGIEAFCTGNAMKYLCRWKKKNGIEDLRKAEWYLGKLIRHIESVESIGIDKYVENILKEGE